MPLKEPSLVSVVMPVYNAERTLAEAIESILAQTFGAFELIIVDDGSKDGTAALLKRYAQADPRVVPLTNPHNEGIARSRNRALAAARGRYVACLDSDDIAESRRLSVQMEYLSSHRDCVLLGSDVTIIDEKSHAVGRRIYPHTDAALRRAMGRQNPFTHSATVFPAAAAREVGGYREDLPVCEDYDLFFRLAERGRIANVPEALTRYRLSSTQSKVKRMRETIWCTRQVQGRALKNGWPDSLPNRLYRMALSLLLLLPKPMVLFAFNRLICRTSPNELL